VIPYLYDITAYDDLQKQNHPMNCMIDLCSPALDEEDASRAIKFLCDHALARSENKRPWRITIIAPEDMALPEELASPHATNLFTIPAGKITQHAGFAPTRNKPAKTSKPTSKGTTITLCQNDMAGNCWKIPDILEE
jgi:hypothetical protein